MVGTDGGGFGRHHRLCADVTPLQGGKDGPRTHAGEIHFAGVAVSHPLQQVRHREVLVRSGFFTAGRRRRVHDS